MIGLRSGAAGALVLGALGFALAMPAQAADVYEPGPSDSLKDVPPVAFATPTTWAGFYVGGHLGAAWAEADEEADFSDFDGDDAQFLGGIHAGYNWQRDRLVFGLEGDASFADDIDYLASVRARLGYAISDRVLLYSTGGVAFGGFDDDIFDDDAVGFVVGGGLEAKVAENVSAGIEGLYYGFDDVETFDGLEDDIDAWVVRARLTYHLNRGYEPLK